MPVVKQLPACTLEKQHRSAVQGKMQAAAQPLCRVCQVGSSHFATGFRSSRGVRICMWSQHSPDRGAQGSQPCRRAQRITLANVVRQDRPDTGSTITAALHTRPAAEFCRACSHARVIHLWA